jgi:flap endonuclease-1
MLKSLDVTREQLIDIAILVGTDFNEGVKGIGPKKALALIKEKGLEKATEEEGFTFEVDPNDVRNVFLKPELTKDYKLKWSDYSPEKILEILSERHEFSEERINSSLEKLEKASHAKDQQSLDKWL